MKIGKQTIQGGNQQFADTITNDNSRHQSVTGNNNNANFGDNATVTQSIQQSSVNQDELKELVSQLQTLINTSPLSEAAKQKALSKTQEIAEAPKKPEAEQKTLVQKTLGYFDGLSDSLEKVPETAVKLGETVGKIALLFGL